MCAQAESAIVSPPLFESAKYTGPRKGVVEYTVMGLGESRPLSSAPQSLSAYRYAYVPNFLVSNKSATVPPATARNALPVKPVTKRKMRCTATCRIVHKQPNNFKERMLVVRALFDSATGIVKTLTGVRTSSEFRVYELTQKGEKAPQIYYPPSNEFRDRS